MIDNNFQTNVIGRDGFFWWVGKVAPLEGSGETSRRWWMGKQI